MLPDAIVVVVVLAATLIVLDLRSQDAPGDCDRTTVLRVATSPAYVDTITAWGKEWSKADAAGRCVKVEASGVSNADTLTGVAGGWFPALGRQPDVWIPDSTTWLERLAQERPSTADLVADAPSVAWSPMVLALPHPMARAIAPEGKPVTVDDLLAVASGGWASRQHPEWGEFRLAEPDPARSTEGVALLLAAASATAKVPVDQLTDAQVDQTASAHVLDQLETAATRLPESVSSLLEDYRGAGDIDDTLAFVSAFPATEHAVWEFNQIPSQVPLSGRYLAGEGASAQLQVFALPEAASPQREAATKLVDFLTSSAGRKQIEAQGLRPMPGSGGSQPTPSFLGGDYLAEPADAPVTLTATPHLPVVEAAQNAWGQLRERTDALALIDVSGSMANLVPGTDRTRLALAVQTITDGLREVPEDAQGGLWSFTTTDSGPDIAELVPLGPYGGTYDGVVRTQAMQNELADLAPESGTPLFDAVVEAYTAAQQAYRPGRQAVVVVLSDGEDEGSTAYPSLDACLTALKAAADPNRPVRIMTVGYGDTADLPTLTAISQATGGATYPVTTAAELESTLPALLFS